MNVKNIEWKWDENITKSFQRFSPRKIFTNEIRQKFIEMILKLQKSNDKS